MNIFFLDSNPKVSAVYNVDKHVCKIPTEIGECLANLFSAERLSRPDVPLTKAGTQRKHSHSNHPISKWLRESRENANWAIEHAYALLDEHKLRYPKSSAHFARVFIDWAAQHLFEVNFNSVGLTEFPQCFGPYFDSCFTPHNPIAGYRKYYKIGKSHLFSWKNRQKPHWLK